MTRRLLLTLMVAVCAFSCTKEAAQSDISVTRNESELKKVSSVVPGEMIVQFDRLTTEAVEKQLMKGQLTNTGDASLDKALEALHATGIERLYEDGGEWEERHRAAGLHQWYVIKYDEDLVVETKAGASPMDAVSGVIYKEPVRRVKAMSTDFFNDPKLSMQWHYLNDGSKSTWKSGADINVLPVWKEYTTGVNSVIVSVVDGGIDMTHEDLNGVVIEAGADGSRNFIDNTYIITGHGHGTHVAGTIGAINNNGIGVCGVAGGNDGKGGVKLLSCQVFNNEKEYGSGFYNAIVWGADHGAVISQNSWGTVYDNAEQARNGSVGATQGAIDYFIKYAGTDKNGNQTGPMKGGVVFFAAGNDGWPDGWPAEYDGDGKCIAVGAFSSMGTRAYYSNYGDWVDIAAPGGDAKIGPQILSTVPGGYDNYQGTSMACPHVSGVAALMVSYFGGPGFTNDMLVERLLGGADTEFLASSANIGPKIDAYGAFKYGNSEAPEGVSEYAVEGTGGNINFNWKVTADPDDGKAFGYILLASTNKADFNDLKIAALPSTMKKAAVATGDLNVGDEIKGNISGLEFTTTYYTAMVAYDYGKTYSPISEIKKVTTTDNQAPVIEAEYDGDWRIRANQDIDIVVDIYDPDFHQISVSFKSDCTYAASKDNSDGTFTLSIKGTKATDGDYYATYIAKDTYGKITQKTFNFTVLPNHAPVVKKELENLLMTRVGQTITINMDDYLYDEDGDAISYQTEHSNSKIMHINPSANTLTMTSLSFGMDEITIHAYDIKKAEGVFSFKVKVRDPDSDADIYPTQVTGNLYVGGGEAADTKIEIYTSAGQLAYEATLTSSAFEPAVVDMSGFAPGVYTVKVTIDGKTTTRTVVKL